MNKPSCFSCHYYCLRYPNKFFLLQNCVVFTQFTQQKIDIFNMFSPCLFFFLHPVQISPHCSLFLLHQYYYHVYNLLLFFFFLALHTKYKNVKPAVLGMLPKETVLLKILFLPKYFQSIWRGLKPQWLSVVFPFTISPGTPSTALSNWIFFQKKKKKRGCTRQFVGLRIILLGPIGMNRGHLVAKLEILSCVSCS